MDNEPRKFSIDELCSLVEMNKRTVRFYVQKGLVSRPAGTGKAAFYSHSHLEQLLAIRKWKEAGLSLERIQEILFSEGGSEGGKPLPPPMPSKRGTVEVWSRINVDDGVEIHIEPGRSGLKPEQVRLMVKEIMNLYRRISEEDLSDG